MKRLILLLGIFLSINLCAQDTIIFGKDTNIYEAFCYDKHYNDSQFVYIPNAVAPTNPALGIRTFKPFAYNVHDMTVTILNTWGNVVWTSSNVQNGVFVGEWDCKINDKYVQPGGYLCIVCVNFNWDENCIPVGKPKYFYKKIVVLY